VVLGGVRMCALGVRRSAAVFIVGGWGSRKVNRHVTESTNLLFKVTLTCGQLRLTRGLRWPWPVCGLCAYSSSSYVGRGSVRLCVFYNLS